LHNQLNEILSGAAQWSASRCTRITERGAFSGVGLAGNKEVRLALAIARNLQPDTAPLNHLWNDLRDTYANVDDPDDVQAIERTMAEREREKQIKNSHR
jgi:hypothetical protein